MRPPESRPEQMLRAMTAKYPGAWQWFEQCRRDRGTEALPDTWPDWCWCPMAAAFAWVTRDVGGNPMRLPPDEMLERMGDLQMLAALSGWRMGRSVYRFDPALSAALLATPLGGRIPVETLYRLPEWCVYVEAPPEWPDFALGFFAHLEHDVNTGRSELRLLYDFGDASPVAIALHMHGESIEEMMTLFIDESNRQGERKGLPQSPLTGHAKEYADNMRVQDCLNLILYLCADEADFGGERPARPRPVKTKRGMRFFPPENLRVWEVGKAMGEQLRAAQTGGRERPEERNAPRPHLRRAHWHTYRVGPGRAETRIRWLHPILVGYDRAESEE